MEQPLDNFQIQYLDYLERRRSYSSIHRREAPAIGFDHVKKMLEDFQVATPVRQVAIAKLLFAEKDSGVLWIQ